MSVRVVLAAAAVVGAGVLAWRLANAGGRALQAAGTALNPADPGNAVNQAVDAIGRSISGDAEWTFGGQLYGWTHTDPTDPGRNTAVAAVNPADGGNLVYRGVSAAGASISGNPSWTLGGWFYDITH